jgi:spore germination cell wall hydrolase CwlJ-like protein
MNKLSRLLLTGCLFVYSSVALADMKQDINCLIEAVYFESRSESFAGQLAVAWVIKNRVEDSRWPNNYCEVVHQKWQFSYYWDGKPENYSDKAAKNSARHTAELVYSGVMLDFTEGAKYYHTTSVRPTWDWSKLEMVMLVDNHIFYRDK